MATLIKFNGEKSTVHPKHGRYFQLRELYELINCSLIEIIHLANGNLMVCDEEAKLVDDWEINMEATELYREGRMSHSEYRKYMKEMMERTDITFIDACSDTLDCVAGDVLVCSPGELE